MKIIDFYRINKKIGLPRIHQLILAVCILGLTALQLLPTSGEMTGDVNGYIVANQLPPASITAITPRGTGEESVPATPPQLGPVSESDPRLILEVANGDNMSILFNRAGLGAKDLQAIASTTTEPGKLTTLRPNYKLAFSLTSTRTLSSLEIIKTPLESYLYTRDDQGNYQFSTLERQPMIQQVYKEAVISDSLFQAAQRGGIPDAMAMDLASIFGGVVDFILEIREGDSFSIVYEEKFLDGQFIGFGKILAAQFINQGNLHTAIRYENASGEANFFNLAGESMRKAFLLNPVDFTRISSGFSLARKHPILNTIRAHKGTDYAAPKGTPVVATADGRITFANRSGSFGKLVVIQHGDRVETKYAHLNDFAKGISSGVKVKQGQVIGYVGATGSATGPHLHYEFLLDKQHRDSRSIHEYLPTASGVASEELPMFRQHAQSMIAQLSNKGQPSRTLARNTHFSPEE